MAPTREIVVPLPGPLCYAGGGRYLNITYKVEVYSETCRVELRLRGQPPRPVCWVSRSIRWAKGTHRRYWEKAFINWSAWGSVEPALAVQFAEGLRLAQVIAGRMDDGDVRRQAGRPEVIGEEARCRSGAKRHGVSSATSARPRPRPASARKKRSPTRG